MKFCYLTSILKKEYFFICLLFLSNCDTPKENTLKEESSINSKKHNNSGILTQQDIEDKQIGKQTEENQSSTNNQKSNDNKIQETISPNNKPQIDNSQIQLDNNDQKNLNSDHSSIEKQNDNKIQETISPNIEKQNDNKIQETISPNNKPQIDNSQIQLNNNDQKNLNSNLNFIENKKEGNNDLEKTKNFVKEKEQEITQAIDKIINEAKSAFFKEAIIPKLEDLKKEVLENKNLNHTTNINLDVDYNVNLLAILIMADSPINLITLAIEAGANDIIPRSNFSRTPTLLRCTNKETADLLVKNGANINRSFDFNDYPDQNDQKIKIIVNPMIWAIIHYLPSNNLKNQKELIEYYLNHKGFNLKTFSSEIDKVFNIQIKKFKKSNLNSDELEGIYQKFKIKISS